MRLATLRRKRTETALSGLHAQARVTRPGLPPAAAIAELARRAKPGDLAVIDVLDLDAPSARLLAGARVAAVVNAAPCVSGRFPARGAQVLVEHGILVVDRAGPEITRILRDGDRVRLDGPMLFRGDDVVARADILDAEVVARLMERARTGLAVQLEAFVANTGEHLRAESDLFLDGDGVPALETPVAGRPVVLVAAGPGWQEDLARLRPWLKASRPVLVGIDEGADALLAASLKPHVIVGNPDLVTEEALLTGAEVVVRADRDGTAWGAARAESLGARTVLFPVAATSEDAALLLVDAHDAATVVTVGSRAAVTDFVDRARADLASAFLTRLKAGHRVIDAATVARIYRPPAATWPMWVLVLLLLAGVAAVVGLSGDASPVGEWRDSAVAWMVARWQEMGLGQG